MKKYLFLLLILAALLRFPYLESFPAFWPDDEPAHAYDAYSILMTGKSFRNEPFPLVLTHFSQNQPSPAILYTYLQIPALAIFGLTETSARLPAAILGSLTPLILIGLTYRYFKNKYIAFFSGLFLAISPWHIFLSRQGLEAITFPFLFLTGWYFLLPRFSAKLSGIFAGICFGLSLSSYQVAILMTPALLFSSFLTQKLSQKTLKTLIMTTCIFSLPFITSVLITRGAIFNHFQDVSIINFNALTQWSLFATFYGSQILPISAVFYYLLPIIFLAYVGLTKLLKSKHRSKFNQLFIIGLLSLIPSALTADSIELSVTRSVAKTGLLEIFAAVALYHLLASKKKKFLCITIILMVINIAVVIKANPYYYLQANDPHLQIKPAITYVLNHAAKYDNVVISLRLNQPFIYLLFYAKTPPSIFHTTPVTRVSETHKYAYEYLVHMGKYTFCFLDTCYKPDPHTLYLGYIDEKPNIDSIITFGTGPKVLRILKNDPSN